MTITIKRLDPTDGADLFRIRRELSAHWDTLSPDGIPEPDVIPVAPHLAYVAGYVDGKHAALWILSDLDAATTEVHTIIGHRGRHHSGALSSAGLAYIFGEGVECLTTAVPDACEFLTARILASAMGFTRTHFQPAVFRKGGVLYGQQHYSLYKETHARNTLRNGGGGSDLYCSGD